MSVQFSTYMLIHMCKYCIYMIILNSVIFYFQGLPIIPFGYPTIALIEKKFEDTKSFIRKNSELSFSGVRSKRNHQIKKAVCLRFHSPSKTIYKIEAKAFIWVQMSSEMLSNHAHFYHFYYILTPFFYSKYIFTNQTV